MLKNNINRSVKLSDISVGLTMGAAGIFCILGVILFTIYTKIIKER